MCPSDLCSFYQKKGNGEESVLKKGLCISEKKPGKFGHLSAGDLPVGDE
jgi:hypothetical protein